MPVLHALSARGGRTCFGGGSAAREKNSYEAEERQCNQFRFHVQLKRIREALWLPVSPIFFLAVLTSQPLSVSNAKDN